jgi:hypothetical protein
MRTHWGPLRIGIACSFVFALALSADASTPAPAPSRIPFETFGPLGVVGASVNVWSPRIILGEHNETCNRRFTVEFKWGSNAANAGSRFDLDWIEVGKIWPETGESGWFSVAPANIDGAMIGHGVLTIRLNSTHSEPSGYSCYTQLRLRGRPNYTAPVIRSFYARFYDAS